MTYLAIAAVLLIATLVVPGVVEIITGDEVFKKWLTIIGVAVLVVFTAFNCIFFVDEQQTAFTSTFGVPTYVEGKGMNFKAPWVSIVKEDATVKGMPVGYDPNTDEYLETDSLMITNDFNFINSDYYIEYCISDPIAYNYGTTNPDEFLRCIAQSGIRNTVGQYGIDEAMTTGRAEIEMKIKETIEAKLANFNTGLSIRNVSTQDVEPPTDEVSAAFQRVVDAQSNAEKVTNEAVGYENRIIPEAEAAAKKLMNEADAAKAERINQAMQEVAEFNAIYEEYLKNPDVVKEKLYYDAIAEIMPKMNIIIGNDVKVISVDDTISALAN